MIINHASTILVPAEFAYQWHTNDGAFQRLTPPWESLELVSKFGDFEDLQVHLKVKKFGVPINWVAQHFDVIPNKEFKDKQLKGPFKQWIHTHTFKALADDRIKMEDSIHATLPLKWVTHLAQGWKVKRDISKMLVYRHQILKHDLELLYQLPMKKQVIGITGASGLLGSHLIAFLEAAGHTVKRIVRKTRPDWSYEICYDPEVGFLDDFSELTAIIHLAGESIASPIRWTEQKKNVIYRSRIRSTQALVQQLRQEKHNVHTFICASASGYYPSSTEIKTETDSPGTDFLSTVTQDWESECDPIRDSIRTCNARFGAVLHPSGGMIGRLKYLMNIGALGPIGAGDQYISWIALDDAIRAIYFMLANETMDGPINVVSPKPQTQKEWVQEWAKTSVRPAIVPLPKTVVKNVMGDMGEQLLLYSSRVAPKKLKDASFNFQCQSMKDVVNLYNL